MANSNFNPQAENGKNPQTFEKRITELRASRLRGMIAYLEDELNRARKLLNVVSPKDAALLAVGNAVNGDGWATSEDVRQFGLTVAYAVIEATLNEDPTLPECFTADDLVIASDVLAGEMSRGIER